MKPFPRVVFGPNSLQTLWKFFVFRDSKQRRLPFNPCNRTAGKNLPSGSTSKVPSSLGNVDGIPKPMRPPFLIPRQPKRKFDPSQAQGAKIRNRRSRLMFKAAAFEAGRRCGALKGKEAATKGQNHHLVLQGFDIHQSAPFQVSSDNMSYISVD